MEGVTFAAGLLERAAHLRPDAQALAQLAINGGRICPLWRGKPLFDLAGGLGWLGHGHPALAEKPLIFLGLQGDLGLFAADLSDWDPEDRAAALAAGFMDQSRQHHPQIDASLGFEDIRTRMATLDPAEAEIAVTAKAILHWQRSHRFCAACGAQSRMVKAGWQRDCPSCGAQHFPRTDPVVIMLVTDGDRLLLGRSPGWPEGMYSLLAGFMEPGEAIEAAVRREVAEETGVRVGPVRILATQPWPWPASLMIGALAEAETTAITLDPAEIEDALWIDRSELVAVLAGQHPRIRPGRKGAIASWLMRNWLADCLK